MSRRVLLTFADLRLVPPWRSFPLAEARPCQRWRRERMSPPWFDEFNSVRASRLMALSWSLGGITSGHGGDTFEQADGLDLVPVADGLLAQVEWRTSGSGASRTHHDLTLLTEGGDVVFHATRGGRPPWSTVEMEGGRLLLESPLSSPTFEIWDLRGLRHPRPQRNRPS